MKKKKNKITINSILHTLVLTFGIYLGIILSQNLLKTNRKLEITKMVFNFNNNQFNDTKHLNSTKILNEKVRILCWVMTAPENEQRLKHINYLWGRKCTKTVYISSKSVYLKESGIQVIGVPVSKESRDTLWGKTKEGFLYVYETYFNDFDWFLKIDDDTYMIYENLQNLLYKFDTNWPLLVGNRYLANYSKRGYVAGMGYVLSKRALKQFFNQIMSNHCRKDEAGWEDFELTLCLQNNSIQVDVRDEFHRHTFFPFSVLGALDPYTEGWWYHLNQFYNISQGVDCCSDKPVAFHYKTITDMYLLDYLIYKVYPFGIPNSYADEELPEKISFENLLLGSLDVKLE